MKSAKRNYNEYTQIINKENNNIKNNIYNKNDIKNNSYNKISNIDTHSKNNCKKSKNFNNYKNCKKWERVYDDNEYDTSSIIYCNICCKNTLKLYKIHLYDDIGEYTCDCGEDVNLVYFCYKCKNKELN